MHLNVEQVKYIALHSIFKYIYMYFNFNKIHSTTGIFYFYLYVLIPFQLTSQQSNWQIGVGVKPATLKSDPYSILVKNSISEKWAWRSGIGGLIKTDKQNRKYEYYLFQSDGLEYNTSKMISYCNINFFSGIQYYFTIRKARFFSATDAGINYSKDIEKNIKINIIDNRIISEKHVIVGKVHDYRTLSFFIRQSIGIEYFISNSFSFSAEGGMQYFKNRLNRNFEETLFVTKDTSGSIQFPSRIDWDNKLIISPLTIINFYYHF